MSDYQRKTELIIFRRKLRPTSDYGECRISDGMVVIWLGNGVSPDERSGGTVLSEMRKFRREIVFGHNFCL